MKDEISQAEWTRSAYQPSLTADMEIEPAIASQVPCSLQPHAIQARMPLMCGRYTLTRPGEVLDETLESLDGFELPGASKTPGPSQTELSEELLSPRYNAAPTQTLPIVRIEAGRPIVRAGRWSLTGSGGRPLINARSETVADKPSFRNAFRQRRCLIPADGFYEWRPDGNRQPFYFHRPGNAGFCFAGLWQDPGSGPVAHDGPEFCIVTANAGPWMAEVHHRRPLILDPSMHARWVDPTCNADEVLKAALDQDPTLERHPVDFNVNRIVNDDTSLLDEVREAPQNLSLF